MRYFKIWPLYIDDCLTLCMLCNFACFFVVCGFFLKLTFFKNHLSGITSVSNSLDPDQVRRFVGPDLGPICLRQLSADNKNRHYWEKS